MSFLSAIILGLIQGLTEFIPVSSSGHLVLGRAIFGIEAPGIFFDILLHLGTLLAVLLYFRKDLLNIVKGFPKNGHMVWMLLIGTLPAFLIGYLVAGKIEQIEHYPRLTAIFLILTGAVFLISERVYKQKDKKKLRSEEQINYKDATVVGLVQSLALLPGVSRSGMTISAGMMMGLKRGQAARFSFLLSIPAILGAASYSTFKTVTENGGLSFEWSYVAGFLVAFASGYAAINFLLKYLQKKGLQVFAYYLFAVGTLLLIFFSL